MSQQGTDLRDFINQKFSQAEIQIFCFEMGLEFEDLPGSCRQEKVLALVQYTERHGRFIELWNKVAVLRPSSWRKFDGEAVPVPEPKEPEPETKTNDLAMAMDLVSQAQIELNKAQMALNQAMAYLVTVKVYHG